MNARNKFYKVKNYFPDKFNKAKILGLNDKEEWTSYLNLVPEGLRDIYYSPEYYSVYEMNGDGKACCFVFQDSYNLAIYPFLINKINDLGYSLEKEYYDIQGAYGYNGVLSTSDDPQFIKSFYNEFNEFCHRNNIIAEFTRFHPLLKNYNFSKDYLDISFNRRTVYVDLTLGYNNIYKRYNKDVRANLRTAVKNNLSASIFTNEFPYKNDFIDMYNKNMDSFNSRDSLKFNRAFFDNIFSNLPLIQFVVLKDNLPIASIICIYCGVYLHAHLLGSNKEYLAFRPINLIFDRIIKYGIENGFNKLHLGGGRTISEDDSLFSFKKKHSGTISEFYVGCKVYNYDTYLNICNQWSNSYPDLIDTYKNVLLKYRYTK